MNLHGKNFIAGQLSAEGAVTFSAVNPATRETLHPLFHEASDSEIDQALTLAERDFENFRRQQPERVAAFLDQIAEEILKLGDLLLERAHAETALPAARLTAE